MTEPGRSPASDSAGSASGHQGDQTTQHEYDWSRVAADRFEELVYWLLVREGFHSIRWFGANGADGGRDLTCSRMEIVGTSAVCRSFVVQCKAWRGSVPRATLNEEMAKSLRYKADFFLLVTCGVLGATTKDWLDGVVARGLPYTVVTWEKGDVEQLLDRHQDVRARFLGIPISEGFLLSCLAHRSRILGDTDRIPMDRDARAVIQRACTIALSRSQRLTTGHLFGCLLRANDAAPREFLRSRSVDVDSLLRLLDRVVDRSGRGVSDPSPELQITPAVRGALELSISLMHETRRGVLSPMLLLLGILRQRSSGTIRSIFGLDEERFEDLRLELERAAVGHAVSYLSVEETTFGDEGGTVEVSRSEVGDVFMPDRLPECRRDDPAS
jgi:hypothetical protein